MQLKFAEVTTYVSDLGAAISFYADILNLKLTEQAPDYAIFDIDGIEFVLMPGAQRTSLEHGKNCCTLPCFESDDIETCIAKMRGAGVRLRHDIQTVPQGQYAVIEDPDGNMIEIIQRNFSS